MPKAVLPLIRCVAGTLSSEQAQFMMDWLPIVAVSIGSFGEVLFCHATPRSDTEVFTRLTTEERIAPAFAEVSAALVICGHTHMQFDRTIGQPGW